MPKYTKEQLEAQYEKLPDALKDAIFSVEIADKMFTIGKKHGLTMEKTGFAAEETGFVILGLLPPREFASSLASRLEIEADKAQALASDINHQVFFPLREALKETHQIDVGEGAIRATDVLPRRAAPPTTPAPPITPTVSVPIAPKTPTPPAPTPVKPAAPPTPFMTPPIPPKKPMPIVLRPKFAEDLEKEIAPLVSGMSTPVPPGFLTRKETEKIIAEKLAEQKPLASSPKGVAMRPSGAGNNQEIRTADGAAQAPDKEKPPQQESKNIVPAPPSLPQEPKAPPPIRLEPLAARLAEKSPVAPPLGTAKVPALDLRNTPKPPLGKTYDGFDPYKEPIE